MNQIHQFSRSCRPLSSSSTFAEEDCEDCNNDDTVIGFAERFERIRQLDEFFTQLLEQLQAKLAEVEDGQLRLFADEEEEKEPLREKLEQGQEDRQLRLFAEEES